VTELANITMDEVKRAADDMSEAEVARARAQMKAGLLMGLESPSSRAERLARMIAIWDRIPSLDEVVAQIDGVTAEDVRNFAGSMAGGAPAAMALYGPVVDAPTIDELQARLVA
jgi:predicted Zn-dependent peptidase